MHACTNYSPLFQIIQIIDFGLARVRADEMTGYVATRYWRAPEIMLNWQHYETKGEPVAAAWTSRAGNSVHTTPCRVHVARLFMY